MRIPKEIVLIPESAVAEFVTDHERVREKNTACKGRSKGAQWHIMHSCTLLLAEWFAID